MSIFDRFDVSSARILEVGALPGRESLLATPPLRSAAYRVGINLQIARMFDGIHILKMDARSLGFPDNSFEMVISSSTLEHIPDFWRACGEMKRVLRSGGSLIVSTPGYGGSGLGDRLRSLGFRLRLPDALKRSTVTMRVHDAPNDYYRFSEFSFRDIVLADLEHVTIWQRRVPPRLFGWGIKP